MSDRPILDRALTPAMMDVALRVGRAGMPYADSLRLLEVALREIVPSGEAMLKTRKALTRIWIRPPARAQAMVGWATRTDLDTDSRVLHLGALFATTKFFGDLCAQVGRQMSLNGESSTTSLRGQMYQSWGQRTSVDVGVRKCVRTLRHFRVLQGRLGSTVSTRGEQIAVPSSLADWLAHSLLLARSISSIEEREIRRAPELFMFNLPARIEGTYGLVDHVNEGGGRKLVVIADAPVSPPAGQLALPV
jgi:hypothetical protein